MKVQISNVSLNKSEKIVAIRIDGKMSYNYSPDIIPAGVKSLVISINDIKIDNNKSHILEIVTQSGKYFKFIL
jgi:hypothetical protein